MLTRLSQKDDQIEPMMTKIDSMQTKIHALSDLMLQKNAESSAASTESNNDL